MKNYIKFLSVIIIASLSFNSCDQEDDLVFTAQEPAEGISFSNSFSQEYVLNKNASGNLGERFTWEDAYFGVPTNVSYELENSISGNFTDATSVGTTDGNELAVTIGQMLGYAQTAGLDDDPTTEAPNTGKLYFRVKAFVGTEGLETFSSVQEINVLIPEIVIGGTGGVEASTWGIVGDAYNNWGAFADAPFYQTDDAGVLVAYVTLIDGKIKFRENNLWDNNFGDTGADGTLEAGGDDIVVNAGTYKITFDTNDNTYSIEAYSWGIVGDATPNGWDGPDIKMYYDPTTNTFQAGAKLVSGKIKFRLNNSWDTNFGDTDADGSLEAGGTDIDVSPGYYNITFDLKNNTYVLEEGTTLGVVGDATPNSWDGPDFRLAKIGENMFYGDIITLVDGKIKFRVNDAWDTNYGDTGVDGTLDAGGDDIAVTAGKYRVMVNLTDNTYQLNKVQ